MPRGGLENTEDWRFGGAAHVCRECDVVRNSFQVHGTLTGCHRRPQWCPCLRVKNNKNSGGNRAADKRRVPVRVGPWKLDINTQENYEHHSFRNNYVRLESGTFSPQTAIDTGMKYFSSSPHSTSHTGSVRS